MLKDFIAEHSQDMIFARNSFRRYLYIALFLLIVDCCMLGFLYYNILTEPTPSYFATTTDGRILNIYPLK